MLVEFTDFQCPYCITFQREVFAALKTKYVETGKLRLFSRNVPQVFHPQAGPAAKAARCAEAQGKFWPMRERLLAAQGAYVVALLVVALAAWRTGVRRFEAFGG